MGWLILFWLATTAASYWLGHRNERLNKTEIARRALIAVTADWISAISKAKDIEPLWTSSLAAIRAAVFDYTSHIERSKRSETEKHLEQYCDLKHGDLTSEIAPNGKLFFDEQKHASAVALATSPLKSIQDAADN